MSKPTPKKKKKSAFPSPTAPKRAKATIPGGPAVSKRAGALAAPDYFHTAAFWGLALLLFLAPFFRGLFFPPEQQKALIFAAIIFWMAWLWKSSTKDSDFLSHPLDYFVLALPVVYLISTFQAINYGLAIDEVIKTVLYFTVFWLASRLVKDDTDIATLLQVIYFTAAAVALAGLATATGVIHIKDGFLGGRIYSTFQYPNALASYLAAATFIGIYLWKRHTAAQAPGEGAPGKRTPKTSTDAGASVNTLIFPDSWRRYSPYLYAACNFLLFATLLGTRSNGGLLVFLVVFALFIAGLPGDRAKTCAHFVFFAAPSLIAIWQFLPAAEAGLALPAWLWLLAGLTLTLAGQKLYNIIEGKGAFTWIAAHKKAVLAAVLLIAIAAVTTAAVYASSHSDTLKIAAEEIRLRNATERMYFFQDALQMFKERPVTGWGGGGWEEAYQAYQSYLYSSRQVHGYYFQVMVETGIVGLLAVLGIWASFLALAHKMFYGTNNQPRRFLLWVLVIAALNIGLHAAVDFDLSLSALALVLWTLFGLVRGMGRYTAFTATAAKKAASGGIAPIAAVTAAVIAVIIFIGALAAAGSHFEKAARAQDLSATLAALQKAAAGNPFNADCHTYLARYYLNTGNYDTALAEARKAAGLSQYGPQRYSDLATINNRAGNREQAVEYAEKALSLAPFHSQWYEFYATTCFTAGFGEITSGNLEAAVSYLEKATRTPDLVTAQAGKLGPVEQKLWKDAPLLAMTPTVHLYTGASQYFLGRWEQSGSNLEAAIKDENTRGEASFWLAILRDKQGKPAADLLEETKRLIPGLADKYEEYKNLPHL